jgi:hypothetical protein
MKPKFCIVGYDIVIDIAKQVASEFSDVADFIFVGKLFELI